MERATTKELTNGIAERKKLFELKSVQSYIHTEMRVRVVLLSRVCKEVEQEILLGGWEYLFKRRTREFGFGVYTQS